MIPYLACGSAAAAICLAVALWRLSAARSPDRAYRAGAIAVISSLLSLGLAAIWLVTETTRQSP
jgi:H+/Cl- antiporter ClcA